MSCATWDGSSWVATYDFLIKYFSINDEKSSFNILSTGEKRFRFDDYLKLTRGIQPPPGNNYLNWTFREVSSPIELNTSIGTANMVTDKNLVTHILTSSWPAYWAFNNGKLIYYSTREASSFMPTRPLVDDGGVTMPNPYDLNFNVSSSHSKGINRYEYAIGTVPGGIDVSGE